MTSLRTGALVALTIAALAAPLAAQTPDDSLGWRFAGNLGYVQTGGNTRLSTVNVGDKLTYRASRWWTFGQSAAWVYGKSNGVKSANQLLAGLRADYWINPRMSAFGSFDYEANPYAGISHRMQELGGLAWKALATPRTTLSIDLGAGVTQERTPTSDVSFAIARFTPIFKQAIGQHSYFEQTLEFVENLKNSGDLRTTSSSVLVAPLTANIGLRMSYLMRYDAVPATAGLKKLDTTFTTGIQITL